MVVASAEWICARRGLCVPPAASNCGGGGKSGRGLRRGGDRFATRIDPLNRYVSRSMRTGCGSLHRGWGPVDGGRRPNSVSDPCKKRPSTRKSLGRREARRFAVSARVALSQSSSHLAFLARSPAQQEGEVCDLPSGGPFPGWWRAVVGYLGSSSYSASWRGACGCGDR
jgi:hypothetical protein